MSAVCARPAQRPEQNDAPPRKAEMMRMAPPFGVFRSRIIDGGRERRNCDGFDPLPQLRR